MPKHFASYLSKATDVNPDLCLRVKKNPSRTSAIEFMLQKFV
jgi:hypothetical protein